MTQHELKIVHNNPKEKKRKTTTADNFSLWDIVFLRAMIYDRWNYIEHKKNSHININERKKIAEKR